MRCSHNRGGWWTERGSEDIAHFVHADGEVEHDHKGGYWVAPWIDAGCALCGFEARYYRASKRLPKWVKRLMDLTLQDDDSASKKVSEHTSFGLGFGSLPDLELTAAFEG